MNIRDPETVTPEPLDPYLGSMNIIHGRSVNNTFASVVLHEVVARDSPTVVDIGCGSGIGRNEAGQRSIREHAGTLWGIEPDPGVALAEGLFDRVERTMMEDADLPDGRCDVAYASFVIEHVQQPEAFLQAVHRCLKPGGCFLFDTPNAAAFFGKTSQIANRLRIDETLLRLVKKPDHVEEYHYPLAYRCNTRKQIDRLAGETGFSRADLAYFQFDGVRHYFPGPLRPVYHLLMAKRRMIGRPESLDTIIGRLTR